MATQNIYDLSDTWNNGATTFTAIKMDVTDTASAAASLLMDLQVGSTSKFNVTKGGQLRGVGGSASIPTYGSAEVTNTGMYFEGAGAQISFSAQGNVLANWGASAAGFRLHGSYSLGFVNGAANATNPDVRLYRDAAATLAQRDGTNAQTFNIYNTYTDASNYERGVFKWDSNILYLQNESAGTGTARELRIRGSGSSHLLRFYNSALDINNYANTITLWRFDNNGDFVPPNNNSLGTASIRVKNLFMGEFQDLLEMTAPSAGAANTVRIYAEDNGSGKTRLMALFQSGAAQQIAIEP